MRRIALTALVLAATLAFVPGARAASFAVTTTADLDGTCAPAPGDCSLRQAVNSAAGSAEDDTIGLPGGEFGLNGGLGSLNVRGGVLIRGAGAGATTVSGNGVTRVIDVAAGAAATISELTVAHGGAPNGAGISVAGQLTLVNAVVSGNHATTAGAGVFNTGGLALDGSTVSSNAVDAYGQGGGIYSNGTFVATNSTISGNVTGANGSGGGAYGAGGVTLRNVTVAANSAGSGSGGNIFWVAGTATYANTIVANGTAAAGANCGGAPAVVALGRNLESADTCGFGAGAFRNVNPLLGPLGPNGGPTPTHALGNGSPAIDTAAGCPPPAIDQRGVPRPQGGACDIGAFEAPPGTKALAKDTNAPLLGSLRMSPSRLRTFGGRGSSVARKRKRGARVRYSLSEPATVTFTVEKKVRGVRVGKRCLRISGLERAAMAKRCRTYKRQRGSFAHAGRAGANKFKFTGRLRGRALRRGSYRLVGVARDAAGNRSKPKRKRFRVVRR